MCLTDARPSAVTQRDGRRDHNKTPERRQGPCALRARIPGEPAIIPAGFARQVRPDSPSSATGFPVKWTGLCTSETKTLTEAEYLAIRKRYRTILTLGGKELPEITPRPKGKRGRIAKSDAHNLHERLVKHETSVLRFIRNPHVAFTNNTGEQKIRMAKVKIKVSGCFRTQLHTEAWCRISSYLSSMAALGYNPLVAIQIALAGNAADMIRMRHEKIGPTEG